MSNVVYYTESQLPKGASLWQFRKGCSELPEASKVDGEWRCPIAAFDRWKLEWHALWAWHLQQLAKFETR